MLQDSMLTATPLTYGDALEWLFAQTRSGAPRDPARMQQLITQLALQSPPKVIHVVGTNGKGSVSAMLAAGFEAEGVRSGRFISPHVVEFRERIAVNGQWIAEAEVLDFVRTLPALNPAPAFFELSLALALAHFARERVEVAVVEAGVGARHDATLALGNVRDVVITNVGRDHLDTLGPTLRDVAYDKADAIRPGVPTVTAATGEALTVITEVAAQRRSPLFFSTPRWDAPLGPLFRPPEGLPDGTSSTPTRRRNQQLAAATLRLHGVGEAAIRQGLRATLPARAERFRLEGKEIVLDGAHNPDAARALLEHLHPPFVLLFGALPKKLGAETLAVLELHASHIILTDATPGEASTLRRAGLEFIAEPEVALQAALSRCKGDQQLVIAGSFYLAGRLRPLLRQSEP